MRPKTITVTPLAKDVDAFATKQVGPAGFIIMTSGAAKVDDVDRNAFCAAQTPTAAGALTMNGVLASQQLTVPRVVTIYCTSDISADTYTLRGWTASEPGRMQTETLTGPNAGTVRSANVYGAVLGVETDTAATSVVEVGQQAIGTPSEPVRVHFTASHNENGVTFTLHGIDRDGKYTSETGLLPTAGGVVISQGNYSKVIGISLSSVTASSMSVGTASKFETQWHQVDRNAPQTMINVALSTSADMSYQVQFTLEDIHATTFTTVRQMPTSVYVNTASGGGDAGTGGTVSDASSYSILKHPVSAVRVAFDNFASGSADVRIVQQRESH